MYACALNFIAGIDVCSAGFSSSTSRAVCECVYIFATVSCWLREAASSARLLHHGQYSSARYRDTGLQLPACHAVSALRNRSEGGSVHRQIVLMDGMKFLGQKAHGEAGGHRIVCNVVSLLKR